MRKNIKFWVKKRKNKQKASNTSGAMGKKREGSPTLASILLQTTSPAQGQKIGQGRKALRAFVPYALAIDKLRTKPAGFLDNRLPSRLRQATHSLEVKPSPAAGYVIAQKSSLFFTKTFMEAITAPANPAVFIFYPTGRNNDIKTKRELMHHRFSLKAYYEDTDFSGVVYHASYLRFAERGRSEFLSSVGISHNDLLSRDPPLAFVVRRMEIDFLIPARVEDELVVETTLGKVKGVQFEMPQIIKRGDEILWRALVVAAVINPHKGKPSRSAGDIMAKLAKEAQQV